MFKKISLVVGLLALSAQASAAGDQNSAKRMQQASQVAKAAIQQVQQSAQQQSSNFNHADYEILDRLLPEISNRLNTAGEKFGFAADIYFQQGPGSFEGRRVFQQGCMATSFASLKLGTAKLKSLDSFAFYPYSSEFEETKYEIDSARSDNGC